MDKKHYSRFRSNRLSLHDESNSSYDCILEPYDVRFRKPVPLVGSDWKLVEPFSLQSLHGKGHANVLHNQCSGRVGF